LILFIKVSPGAKKERFSLSEDGTLKCYVTAPPVDGKANAAVISALCGALKLSRAEVCLVSGHTSRLKKIEIHSSLTKAQILAQLGLGDTQNSLF